MKRFIIILSIMASFLTAVSCQKEIIEWTPPSSGQTEDKDKDKDKNVDVPFELVIDNQDAVLVYPVDGAPAVEVPFTVMADKKLEHLSVNATGGDALKVTVTVGESKMDGVISIEGTEAFKGARSQAVNITATSLSHTWRGELVAEEAFLNSYAAGTLQFSFTKHALSVDVESNVACEVYGTEGLENAITAKRDQKSFVLYITENESFEPKYGNVVITDKAGLLDPVVIPAKQSGMQGSRYTDSLALVAIYHKLHLKECLMTGYARPDLKGPMYGWLTKEPLENWIGVQTSWTTHRVDYLNLILREHTDSWEEYKYSLPDEIGDLKCLSRLYISGPIAGELPQSFGNLERLHDIEIYGPNLLTGNLETHNIGKVAKSISYFCVNGIFQGGVPEWLADTKEFRIDGDGFSGRIPERVLEHSSIKDVAWLNSSQDPRPGYGITCMYPDLNKDAEFANVDHDTLSAYYNYRYAVWCDTDMPKGVVKVNGRFGEHYEWESFDALVDYLEQVRVQFIDPVGNLIKYENLRENTGGEPDETMDYFARFYDAYCNKGF